MRRLPDFLICGAQKCGTTSLFLSLKNHPEICMSSKKEIHFFDKKQNYKKGIQWYKKFFKECSQKKATGEATPHYYRNKKVPRRIRKTFESVKLIFILRDPSKRAYSNYQQNREKGYENREFRDAIFSEDGKKRYIEKGFYYRHIRRFLKFFDKKSIKIVTLEKMLSDENKIKDILSFIGVERAKIDLVEANKTKVPSSDFSSIIRYVYHRTSGFIPRRIKRWTKELRKKVDKMTKKENYDEIKKEDLKSLSKKYYKDMKKLESRLGVNVSQWDSYKIATKVENKK
jgi:hypothetical protein